MKNINVGYPVRVVYSDGVCHMCMMMCNSLNHFYNYKKK